MLIVRLFSAYEVSFTQTVHKPCAYPRVCRLSCTWTWYLVAAKAIHGGHADAVQQHTQALEGDDGETQDAILLRQTWRIVPTEDAAVLTRHTASRDV